MLGVFCYKKPRYGKEEYSFNILDYFSSITEVIKAKAEDLYKYALEKGTPVVEKAADEVRKQALKVVKEIEKKLESDKKRK